MVFLEFFILSSVSHLNYLGVLAISGEYLFALNVLPRENVLIPRHLQEISVGMSLVLAQETLDFHPGLGLVPYLDLGKV
jgi:hypothetical protein